MDRLVAGPWVGEFGWELFNWQGKIRYLSDYYSSVKVICRKSSAFLYEDFASDFVFIETGDLPTENNLCHGWDNTLDKKILENAYWENPQNLAYYLDNGVPTIGNKKQKFIKFGSEEKIKNRIIIHARDTNKCNTGYRDWPKHHWEEFVNELKQDFEIISIGTSSQSLHIDGTVDLRNKDLKTVCNCISGAKLIVGPSSGPLHLASLCGTPQIVWSGHARNKYRYEKLWNPFNTKVVYIDIPDWQPSVKLVLTATQDNL